MNISIKATTQSDNAISFITQAIIEKLELGKRVLWFATGGSSIDVCVEISKLIASHPHRNLAVMLTDERYGPIDNPESNWHQLMKRGFNLPEAELIPILTGDNSELTAEKFNKNLDRELSKADYKIGLFGIGTDFHTAGILPHSPAVYSLNLACGYNTPVFERITMTPKAILMLDVAVVFTKGEAKQKVIEELIKSNANINEQPAQILKKAPRLIIFTSHE
jgi:6-phosphogluconolactonase/glucosamine-6-phosphate isomerase/deaminase